MVLEKTSFKAFFLTKPYFILLKSLFSEFLYGKQRFNLNLPEQQNTEDHMGFNQNEEPIASFNKLRDEVFCLKTQVSEVRVDELWSLAKKFPLLVVKVFQYIHSMQLITARMREEVSELRNEMIEMKSENIVCKTRNTSGSTKTLAVSSRRIGIKESKPQPKLFNAAGSEVKKTQQAVAKSRKAARLNLLKEKV